MSTEHANDHSFLDHARINKGNDGCRTVFREAYEDNKQKAIDLINDPNVTFPCLFILMPQIDAFNLHADLDSRGAITVGIVRQIADINNTIHQADYFSAKDDEVHSVLKWILQTGCDEYGLGNSYQKVLDISASVLINTYKDKSILPIVDTMIFKRRKLGHNFHDLLWAFFRTGDLAVLKLVAAHILSSDREEAEFATELLTVETLIGKGDNNPQTQYKRYLHWLEDNGPLLRFTGESYQFTSRPVMYHLPEKSEMEV